VVETLTPAGRSKLKRPPRHVAIIMDGNGRWAKQRGLPRLAGHRAGTESIRRIVETFADYNVKYLTLYAFSTENWGRPRAEVMGLLRLMGRVIDREMRSLHENNVKVCHLGQSDMLPKKLMEAVWRAVELTKNNTRITLSIAFNYGGRSCTPPGSRTRTSSSAPAARCA